MCGRWDAWDGLPRRGVKHDSGALSVGANETFGKLTLLITATYQERLDCNHSKANNETVAVLFTSMAAPQRRMLVHNLHISPPVEQQQNT